ncbi:MAG: hypothetical protein A0129_07975 [Limnobacter sp. CACIAM 66H1]|nr:MAG: hypothetical protein A0129_07975 [Limnobacter sp. CACIAM 66H1]
MFRSPRLQENLPLRAEQCRCCPAWATENGPDPLFWRAVLRHREAQQGEYRFSGERSEPKPIGLIKIDALSEPKPIGLIKIDALSEPKPIGLIKIDALSEPKPSGLKKTALVLCDKIKTSP